MTSENLNEIIKIIRSSSVEEKKKDELTIELLTAAMQKTEDKFFEERSISRTENINSKKSDGNLLNPQEEQMLINLPGVSVNSVPRKDGRFQGYFIGGDGVKKYFYGRSYKDVVEKIQIAFRLEQTTMKRQAKEEARIESESMQVVRAVKTKKKGIHPFNEYLESWIEKYKAPNVKIKSLECIKTAVKPACLAFGNKPMEEITSDDIQELLISIQAPRMRELCKINISQVFKKAMVQGIIFRNPCDAVEIKKHRTEHKKALTIEEQNRFLQESSGSPYSLLYRLMLATGLRIGEALALTKRDIDFKNSKLTINKDVVFVKGERIVQDTPKSAAGNRTVPIPENLCWELKDIEPETLFPCSYNAVKKAMEKIAARADIKMTLHTLRHTYATRLEEAGVPPKIKQYLLGHASLEMTQNTYTDTQMPYVDSVSEKVRAIF